MRPEDVLPDGADRGQFNGQSVRKGTVKAAIENVKIIESATTSAEQKYMAKKMIEELLPDLFALEVPEFLTWKNLEVQALIDNFKKTQTQTSE